MQDYHWWWRSFLTSGFTAFYLAIYCVHYFITKLDIVGSASTFLYFGYTSVMVFCFFLLTGEQIPAVEVTLANTCCGSGFELTSRLVL